MINKEIQEQAIALCQKLVQQKSYSGHEDGPAKVLEEVCRANSFDSIHVDKYGNFIAPASKANVLGRSCCSTAIWTRCR